MPKEEKTGKHLRKTLVVCFVCFVLFCFFNGIELCMMEILSQPRLLQTLTVQLLQNQWNDVTTAQPKSRQLFGFCNCGYEKYFSISLVKIMLKSLSILYFISTNQTVSLYVIRIWKTLVLQQLPKPFFFFFLRIFQGTENGSLGRQHQSKQNVFLDAVQP